MIKNLAENETISLYFTNFEKGHRNYPYLESNDFETIRTSLHQDHNYLFPNDKIKYWHRCKDLEDIINELIHLNTADNYITMIVNTQINLF